MAHTDEYGQWYREFAGCRMADLMIRMLKPGPGDTMLVAGCGDGSLFTPFIDLGVRTTGIEATLERCKTIREKTGQRVDVHIGDAEDLVFDDNSFNYVCLMNVIEFTKNPEDAIREALRVARDKVFIWMLNKYSVKGIEVALRKIFGDAVSNQTKLYGIGDIKQTVKSISTDFPMFWRTVCHVPAVSGKMGQKIAQSNVAEKYPFGSYVGFIVIPVPRFRTRPLVLKCSSRTEGVPAG